jgi:hypothetical protein
MRVLNRVMIFLKTALCQRTLCSAPEKLRFELFTCAALADEAGN